MVASVLGHYPYYQIQPMSSPFEFGLFEPLSRITWSISVCYMIFACIHDSGGVVNWFLSLSIFQPFSKLSYGIYLNHCYLMTVTMVSLKIPPYFDELSAFQNYLSILMLATIVAIPLVLAFELPIDAINKLRSGIRQAKPPSTPSPVRLREKNNNNANKKIANGKKPHSIKWTNERGNFVLAITSYFCFWSSFHRDAFVWFKQINYLLLTPLNNTWL